MRRATPLLPLLAAALLLAGCGSERAGSPSGGGRTSAAPWLPVSDPGVDGVRITGLTAPSPGGTSGVSTTHGVSAAYEVTNDGPEARTYTVLFDFTTAAGEVMTNTRQTVRDVGPGRTVRRTVDMPPLAPGASDVTRVKVSEITYVPAGDAPAEPGA
jgi:hypothetical protein